MSLKDSYSLLLVHTCLLICYMVTGWKWNRKEALWDTHRRRHTQTKSSWHLKLTVGWSWLKQARVSLWWPGSVLWSGSYLVLVGLRFACRDLLWAGQQAWTKLRPVPGIVLSAKGRPNGVFVRANPNKQPVLWIEGLREAAARCCRMGETHKHTTRTHRERAAEIDLWQKKCTSTHGSQHMSGPLPCMQPLWKFYVSAKWGSTIPLHFHHHANDSQITPSVINPKGAMFQCGRSAITNIDTHTLACTVCWWHIRSRKRLLMCSPLCMGRREIDNNLIITSHYER